MSPARLMLLSVWNFWVQFRPYAEDPDILGFLRESTQTVGSYTLRQSTTASFKFIFHTDSLSPFDLCVECFLIYVSCGSAFGAWCLSAVSLGVWIFVDRRWSLSGGMNILVPDDLVYFPVHEMVDVKSDCSELWEVQDQLFDVCLISRLPMWVAERCLVHDGVVWRADWRQWLLQTTPIMTVFRGLRLAIADICRARRLSCIIVCWYSSCTLYNVFSFEYERSMFLNGNPCPRGGGDDKNFPGAPVKRSENDKQ
jgi:hypothetical protein